MLYYILAFLMVAIMAGILGFGGVAGASAGAATIMFYLFLLALIVSLAMGVVRWKSQENRHARDLD